MRAYELIMKKRNGKILSKEEINYFVEGYTKGNIPDYQASALAMAIYFQGLDERETADLTMAMVNSGDKIDLSSIEGIKVDKHSTGGVGDTTTLVLAPWIAAAGVPMAKMSGRGLGHTGGTLDKLESIPGFNISIGGQEFIDSVNTIGVAVVGQTGNLVPADKKLYALRDVTATVENIPLIAASIMSKKIAAGADAIVLDVKVGSGAFMKTKEEAFQLARAMVDIGTTVGRRTVAVITNMDQPLGNAIGNVLEVKEAIDILQGRGPSDLHELCIVLGSYMLQLAGVVPDVKAGRKRLFEVLEEGLALTKLKEMIHNQQGDSRVIDNPALLSKSKYVKELKSKINGYVNLIEAQEIGLSAMMMGAGRETKEDIIDYSAGVILKKKIGDTVEVGETLAVLYSNNEDKITQVEKRIASAFEIGKEKEKSRPLVYGVVTADGDEYFN